MTGRRRYIGRLGIGTEERDPRPSTGGAPAAAAFHRATPQNPMGVVRRRVLHCRGERVRDIEDDLLDPGAAPADMAVVGDGAFPAALSQDVSEPPSA